MTVEYNHRMDKQMLRLNRILINIGKNSSLYKDNHFIQSRYDINQLIYTSMKRIISYKLFESNVEVEGYIQQCFLDVSENPNFEVDDLIKVELTEKPKVPMSVYKIHIEPAKSISLRNISYNDNMSLRSASDNMRKVGAMKIIDLNFLIKKNEIMSELYQDIDIALKRVKDKFSISDYQIYANSLDEIDVVIIIKD